MMLLRIDRDSFIWRTCCLYAAQVSAVRSASTARSFSSVCMREGVIGL
jgi:hypothetical protein